MKLLTPEAREGMDYSDILYEKTSRTATITINRPHALNAFSKNTLQEMIEALQNAIFDDGVAAIVITGAGLRAFCAGADIIEYSEEFLSRPRNYWKWMDTFIRFNDLLRNSGKPTIAKLNGLVIGGGNEINMSCDLAVAAEHVFIQHVGTSVGSVAAGGATQFLPIMVGDRRAREMLFLNEPISAYKALEWGLINYVVPIEELDSKVKEICEKLILKFPECTRYTKHQLNFWKDFSWNMTIGHAREWLSLHFSSLETLEGMQSFVEKRKPDYLKIRKKLENNQPSETLWGGNIKECPSCKQKYLPEEFNFCGKCGKKLC